MVLVSTQALDLLVRRRRRQFLRPASQATLWFEIHIPLSGHCHNGRRVIGAVLATEPQSPVLGRGSRQASGLATAAHLADLRGLMAVLVGDGHDGLRA